MPNTPALAYAAGYDDDHGAATDCGERELWRAVLRQAGLDLSAAEEQIRADAIAFFETDDLLQILDFAGINLDLAPAVRARARAICQRAGRRRRGVTYRGETRTIAEWAAVSGVNVCTLGHRLRHGWPIAKALTTPGRRSPA